MQSETPGLAATTAPDAVPPASPAMDRGLPVTWALASATAARLMQPGPRTTPAAASALVERLRTDSALAEGHVREVTGLGAGLPLLPADVLDRPAWARAAEKDPEGPAGKSAAAQLLPKLDQQGEDAPKRSE